MENQPAFTGTVHVHYGQIYLASGGEFDGDLAGYVARPDGAGIIGAKTGYAVMITGRHTGEVSFRVETADHDPGAALDTYEDVVEVSLTSTDGELTLEEWGEDWHRLPPLPHGPGPYRLRYHARGMDLANDAMVEDGVVDEYLLQIWPAATSPVAVLKITSRSGRYWQSAFQL